MRVKIAKKIEETEEKLLQLFSPLHGEEPLRNPWEYEKGKGGGCANLFSMGKLFERGAVNRSSIQGEVSNKMAALFNVEGAKECSFSAMGLSIVFHPRSPWIPTFHANYRYFELHSKGDIIQRLFGGGIDLTPYYLNEEEVIRFHSGLKEYCDRIDQKIYPQYKQACDRYFYLPHRKEHRGVGGIFALRLETELDKHLEWCCKGLEMIAPSYLPLCQAKIERPFGERERRWQLLRRGRYVEFNLLYDEGTKFGFDSGGFAKNILVSLPPNVSWEYQDEPLENSPEAQLMEVLRTPRDWIP